MVAGQGCHHVLLFEVFQADHALRQLTEFERIEGPRNLRESSLGLSRASLLLTTVTQIANCQEKGPPQEEDVVAKQVCQRHIEVTLDFIQVQAVDSLVPKEDLHHQGYESDAHLIVSEDDVQ